MTTNTPMHKAEVFKCTVRKLDNTGHTNEREMVLDTGRRVLSVETKAGLFNKVTSGSNMVDIPFSDIEETRTGFRSDLFEKYFKQKDHAHGTLTDADRERCLTVIYLDTARRTTIASSAHQTLSVVFPDTSTCRQWLEIIEHTAINGNIYARAEWMTPMERRLAEAWFSVAPAGSHHHETYATVKDLRKILEEANLEIPEKDLEKILQKEGLKTIDRLKDGEWRLSGVDYYRHILPIVRRRPWVEQMFCRMAGRQIVQGSTSNLLADAPLRPSQSHVPADATIGFEEFLKFIRNVQKDTERLDQDWLQTFEKYAPTPPPITDMLSGDQLDTMTPEQLLIMSEKNPTSPPPGRMGYFGFLKFLTGDENLIFSEEASQEVPYQDMTRPLQEYWIRSSHNTYLMGDQLKGTSSAEGYIFALKSGVRCVELDVWDGWNGEPCVTHGHTLVNKVPLKDCLIAIKEYAFQKTDYPLILSIEQHASLNQQVIMVQQLREIFGPMLLDKPVPGVPVDGCASPEQLRGKVLLKHKRLAGQEMEYVEEEYYDEGATMEQQVTNLVSEVTEGLHLNSHVAGGGVGSEDVKGNKKKTENVAPEMSALAIYCVNGGFKSLAENNPKAKPWLCSSIVETKSETLANSERDAYMEFTSKQMVRVYPSGGRVASTNYNPWPHWDAGCQIVALNVQSYSKGVRLAKSLFRLNGGCGYVLKPEWMRQGGLGTPGGGGPPTLVTITVISAQLLPKSRYRGTVSNPYVQITCVGNKVKRVKRSDYFADAVGMATEDDLQQVQSLLPKLDKSGGVIGPTGSAVEGVAPSSPPLQGNVPEGVQTVVAQSPTTVVSPQPVNSVDMMGRPVVPTSPTLHSTPPLTSSTSTLVNSTTTTPEKVGYMADFKTKTVQGNGFAPFFVTNNRDDFEACFYVERPDTSFLLLDIYNNVSKGIDDPIALWVGRVMDMRQGYRLLRLDSNTGGKLGGSTLFVHVEVRPLPQVLPQVVPQVGQTSGVASSTGASVFAQPPPGM